MKLLAYCRLRITNIKVITSLSIASNRYLSYQNLDEAVTQYERDGVVLLKKVFDKKWMNIVKEGIKKNIKNPSKFNDYLVDENGKGLFFNDYYNYDKISEYREYITKSPAAEIAGRLMKTNKCAFFHEHVFYKEQGSARETPWHHDFTYYPLNGFQTCSIWMPITHVKKQSSVKFIRKSHLWKQCFVPTKFESSQSYVIENNENLVTQNEKFLGEMGDINKCLSNVDENDILQWEVEPGDCIAFHMRCVHGTEQSLNPENRIVMVTRWLGDDISFIKRPWETSPPEELLPSGLNIGDRLVDNENTLILWKQ